MDANVWVSAALGPSSRPAETVRRLVLENRVVLSGALVAEVRRSFRKPRLARLAEPDLLSARFESLSAPVRVLDPPPLPAPVCRDPDDDHVLALALHAEAGWIVTGDRDLLVLDPWEGIRIVAPGDVE